MLFGVLGALEIVEDSGNTIHAGPPLQRALLALLLCEPGRTVSTERLIDDLWSGRPPRTARASLHLYVHRLRQLLSGDHRLQRVRDGYAIVLAPDELDADRFQRLVDAAIRSRIDEDPRSAARQLSNAAALWRGEAFADLPDLAPLRRHAERLEDRRLVALELLYECRLELGEHVQVVPELYTVVERNPIRERFRSQLMLALYRAGRRAEALEVYRVGRRYLMAELGLEPGHELRGLEHKILTGDPDLGLRPDPARSATRPAELPGLTDLCVGRQQELDEVRRLLTGTLRRPDVIAIYGPGGIGKSTLANHAAHKESVTFPNGVLYVRLHGSTPGVPPVLPIDALHRLLRSLGLRESALPLDADAAAARLRSETFGRRFLVVLDDVLDAAQAKLLLPGPPSVALLTSRRMLSALGHVEHVGLEGLALQDATEMLSQCSGRDECGGELERLARLCDGLPLALRIIAARLVARPDRDPSLLYESLADTETRLDALQYDDLSVRASLAVSIHELDPGVTRLLALLGTLNTTDYSTTIVAALLDSDLEAVDDVLEPLIQAQLVSETKAGRYTMHDLVRIDALERSRTLIPEGEGVAALRRVAHRLLAAARSIAETLLDTRDTGADRTSVLDWLAVERDNLLAITRQVAEHAPDLTTDLASVLHSLFDLQPRSLDMLVVDELAVAVARDSRDPRAAARALTDLGSAYLLYGRFEQALDALGQAAERWRSLDDPIEQANCSAIVGHTSLVMGRPAEANRAYQRLLEFSYTLADKTIEVRARSNLGRVHRVLGNLDESLAQHRAAAELLPAVDDLRLHAGVYGNLAHTYVSAGRPGDAAPLFRRAVYLTRQASLLHREAEFSWFLADALHRIGEHDQARAYWDRALDILSRTGWLTADQAAQIVADDPPVPPGFLTRWI